MNHDRIHAALDGELPLEELTPHERARAAELGRAAAEAARRLRASSAPDLAARVMAALPARPARRGIPAFVEPLVSWLWRPRRVTLRPAYGLAFAALAAVALVLARPREQHRAVAAAPAARRTAAQPEVYVQFRVEVPNARTVALAGSFTGWKPEYRLHQTRPGEWTLLVPLPPGVHDYAFVIDGRRWIPDPNAPQVDDNFGGTNSRISLPPLGAT